MNIFRNLFKKERVLSIDDVAREIYEYMEENFSEYTYLHGIYLDNDGRSFAIAVSGGKMYRINYSVLNGEVEIFEPSEVEYEFTPVSRTQEIVIRKISDTESIWYGRVASAVLNRNAEIDTKKLFDYFEENYIADSAYLTLSHLPEKPFAFGVVRGVFRYNEFLIGYGTIDTSTPLGKSAERAISTGEYGFSIGFYSDKGKEIEIGGIKIRTYEVGELLEISVLKEETAASHFTKAEFKERNLMDKPKAFSILRQFLGDDEEAKKLLDSTEEISREIKESNLITRDGDREGSPIANTEEAKTMNFELSEEVLEVISRSVAEKVAEGFKETFSAITNLLSAQDKKIAELETRNADADKIELDKPAIARSAIVRPTEKNASDATVKFSLNELMRDKLASTKVK